jgi:tetratricopeptide (TPR) repeat protein
LELLRDRGDRAGVASALAFQGNIARLQGEREGARDLFEQGLALYRALDNKRGMGHVYQLLGNLALDAGDEGQAADCYASALTLSRAIGDGHLSALIQGNQGNLARRQQDAERARVCWLESLTQLQSCGHRLCRGWALAHMGLLAGEGGDHERGVRLIAAATATHSWFWTSLDPEQRRDCAVHLRVGLTKLGEERYTACWTAGRAWAVEDAIAAALANDGGSDERRSPARGEGDDG